VLLTTVVVLQAIPATLPTQPAGWKLTPVSIIFEAARNSWDVAGNTDVTTGTFVTCGSGTARRQK
jgi:hypothetical protein